jgi:hypothetical protein
MTQYSSAHSICATCANWAGARIPIGIRGNYKISNTNEKNGQCYQQNLSKNATATCSHFTLWGVLKR